MDRANMPQGSDQKEQSDDLIAELARLMAEEAQADRPGAAPQRQEPQLEKSPEPKAAVKPEVTHTPSRAQTAPRANYTPHPDYNPNRGREEPAFDPRVSEAAQSEDTEFDFGLASPKQAEPAMPVEPSVEEYSEEPQLEEDPIGALIKAREAEAVSTRKAEVDASAEQWEASANSVSEDFVAPADEDVPTSLEDLIPESFETAPSKARAKSGYRDPLEEIEGILTETNQGFNAYTAPQSKPRITPEASDQLDDAALAAEAAIMAASENTRPSYSSYDTADVSAGADDYAERDGGGSSPRNDTLFKIVVPALAGTVLLVIALGMYWFFGMRPSGPETAPVMASNTADSKVAVEQPAKDDGVDSVVIDELDGKSADTADENLVSRDQSEDISSAPVRQVDEDDTTQNGLANRRVRTVTVLPDGTIVSGDDSRAGNEVLPVDRPNVPELPGADANATQTASSADADGIRQLTEGNSLTSAADAEEASTLSEASSSQASVPEGEVVENAPFPAQRISELKRSAAPRSQASAESASTNGGSGAVDLLSGITPVETPSESQSAPVTSTSAASSGAFVQLSSQRSQEAAQQTVATLERRFGDIIGSGQLQVQQVDLDGRGTFFRVNLPVSSVEQGNSVCSQIKTAGGDCFVLAN